MRTNRRLASAVAAVAALTATFTFSEAACADPGAVQTTCEPFIAAAARRYDIPLAVFYAVGLQETGGRDRLQPFASNVDGRAVPSATLEAGLAAVAAAQGRGARSIDVGCMQINVRFHGAMV